MTGTRWPTPWSTTGHVLIDDPGRIGAVTALGLDETLFWREGR